MSHCLKRTAENPQLLTDVFDASATFYFKQPQTQFSLHISITDSITETLKNIYVDTVVTIYHNLLDIRQR